MITTLHVIGGILIAGGIGMSMVLFGLTAQMKSDIDAINDESNNYDADGPEIDFSDDDEVIL
jgi:hypothetical protein